VKAEAFKRFGSINGVIHSALVLNDGAIQLKTPEITASVLSPKLKGTLVLDSLFKDTKLDFFVNFSSLSSIMGGVGQIDYCAASAFLDAYANANCGRNGEFITSINWGAWREVGKFLQFALERSGKPEEALKEGMSNQEGLEAFKRIISSNFSQVLVSPIELEILKQRYTPIQNSRPEEVPEESLPLGTAHQRAMETENYVAPRNEIEQILADIWQKSLGIEMVSVHDNFFELGGDSVISLQITSKANQAGVQISTQQIFKHQTIAELAESVDTSHDSKVDQTSDNKDKNDETTSSSSSEFAGARLSKDELDRFMAKISNLGDKS
ncbi:MAG: KR domain-containing protein, partial [Candidatus Peregrinibacteria bacterium]|nr:KR domain-containing protein [Candidatus Peregrinibacteria bacterium]